MGTLQVRIDDALKSRSDALFVSLGMDTSTAIRIFLSAAIENNGIPFPVKHNSIPASLQEAVYDTRNRTNLHGPFEDAESAVASMLGD